MQSPLLSLAFCFCQGEDRINCKQHGTGEG
jgi:hypothetical protein